MNVKLLNEIDYLTRLIKKYKSESSGNLPNSSATNKQNINMNISECQSNLNTFPKSRPTDIVTYEKLNNNIHIKPSTMSCNVYVNPYFKPQNPVVHINPKMHMKPFIHVNPKMVKSVASTNETTMNNTSNIMNNSQQNLTQMDIKKLKLHTKPSIHVNPKIMTSIASSTSMTESNYTCVKSGIKESFIQTDVKKSVYINPKLISKLSSTKESEIVEKRETVPNFNQPACSRLKFIRKIDTAKTPIKKTNMSNILLLSKRKLIRAKRTMKGNAVISQIGPQKVKKPSPTKKIKTTILQSTKNIVANNNTLQCNSNDINLSKVHNAKTKVNKYKIDRTIQSLTEPKKSETSQPKKAKYNSMELVTIGGIVYKSSRNQLVRRSYSLKRKLASNNKNDKFIITTNGKKLCRLKISKDVPNRKNAIQTTESKLGNMITSKITHKNNISNKVKQRSIQILRNKMRKNNQPCLFFQRFGYCANQKKGTCSKLHDKKQISVCKKFLQGKCLLDACPLSHDVGPEKMPTCKYFLEACCTRDQCPYRHVKVSSSTPICIEFLQGYCSKGNECKLRHEYLCPEYNKTSNCSKGKYCPYPHKPTTSTARQNNKYLQKEPNATKSQSTSTIENDTELTNHECRLRYYESTDTVNNDLATTKDNIMKKVQIIKNVAIAQQSGDIFMNEEISNNNIAEPSISEKESTNFENKLPKRLPLGILPAFIPIN
ncbi:zinc finger CCCH domain-containing protein 3 isoform X1 [Vespa velutina]|uniref:zinc finger CCCH domain-containing protein 3 isoform X1 n=1 Tax=Vespa velutina TaxID=202808 RepID=UPI001FB42B7E|nr:zinc finger CCCH domain-containing protein 3 isoform X1 [Vespa velutina]